MKRDQDGWFSPRLDRHMDLLWFGDYGPPLLLFPAAMGRYYQSEEHGIVQALAGKIERGEVQLCCLDSVDDESWYADDRPLDERVRRHMEYDEYIREELAPYIQNRSGYARFSTFGPSFGGFHAINFACRHPELVDSAISFSGFFDLHRMLNGYWDENCYFHCPTAYVENMDREWSSRLAAVHFVLSVGEQDHLSQDNRDFAGLLQRKGIPCRAEYWRGVFGHDWSYWREHLPEVV